MNKIWELLNGKKTVISAIAGNVLTWLFATGKIDSDTMMLLSGILSAITGVAIGHKMNKIGKVKKN